jgi:hypothetical protein
VSKLSKGKQKPTSRIENRSLDYRVWWIMCFNSIKKQVLVLKK